MSSSTERRGADVLTAVPAQVSADAWPAAHGKPDCPTTHSDTENTPQKALCRQRAGIWRRSGARSRWVLGVGRLARGPLRLVLCPLLWKQAPWAGWAWPCMWGRPPPSLPGSRLLGPLRSLLAEFPSNGEGFLLCHFKLTSLHFGELSAAGGNKTVCRLNHLNTTSQTGADEPERRSSTPSEADRGDDGAP